MFQIIAYQVFDSWNDYLGVLVFINLNFKVPILN